jgi:hypothetical protein
MLNPVNDQALVEARQRDARAVRSLHPPAQGN